jgi:hypothetical protein
MLRGRSPGPGGDRPMPAQLHTASVRDTHVATCDRKVGLPRLRARYTGCNVCKATAKWVYLDFCQEGAVAWSMTCGKDSRSLCSSPSIDG